MVKLAPTKKEEDFNNKIFMLKDIASMK